MYGKNEILPYTGNDMKKTKFLTLSRIRSLMEKTYTLARVDSGDNLAGHLGLVRVCLNAGSGDALRAAAADWYEPFRAGAAERAVEVLRNRCVERGYAAEDVDCFFSIHGDRLREEIYVRDISDPLRELIRNTGDIPVRVEMVSNYDCINSHWLESSDGYGYRETYFGDMVDALNLNPARVKTLMAGYGERMTGRFPARSLRNGREQVSYEEFYREIVNSCCGANMLTYVAVVSLEALFDADFRPHEIIVPKGNFCGLYSSEQGGGSLLEMTLLRNVTLRLGVKGCRSFRLAMDCDDSPYGFAIRDVYGVSDSFFGGALRLVTSLS